MTTQTKEVQSCSRGGNTAPAVSVGVTLPLSRGLVTTVSPEDADLGNLKWYASSSKNGFYAIRKPWHQPTTYLHRVIVERVIDRSLLPDEVVDHINGDPLMNTRSNLRVATRAQNMHNSKRPITNKSGYKGVHYSKKYQRWVSQIRINGSRIHVGSFDDPQSAYEAYCKVAQEHFGEFANG